MPDYTFKICNNWNSIHNDIVKSNLIKNAYPPSSIKRLIDRLFRISSNWNSFHNDRKNIEFNRIKNAYETWLNS